MKKLRKKTGRLLPAVLALVMMVSGLLTVTPKTDALAADGVITAKEQVSDVEGQDPKFWVSNEHGTNLAMCVDFNAATPKEGYTVGTPQLSNNDNLRKVLYYGNSGPADIGVVWSSTAKAASAAMGNIPLSGSTGWQLVYTALTEKPTPPENFKVYVVATQDGYQPLAYWVLEPTGGLELYKKSSNESISSGNGCYSLAGCEVAVYKHGTDEEAGRFTTDANGYGGVIGNLPAGQYDLKELKAPKGFVLNTEIATVTVTAGQTVTYTMKNEPANDPVYLLLKKIDADGNVSAGETGAFAGAQYTFEYYDGQFSEAQLSGKAPVRTWILATDNDGHIYFDDALKISGDEFYTSYGKRILPVGTYKVHEIKAPAGYSIDPTAYIVNITAEDFTGALIKSYQTVTSSEQVYRGGVEVQKMDSETGSTAQGDATLAGAEFTVYNRNDYSVIVNSIEYAPGEAVLTLVTDADGYAASTVNALPYGDYGIAETKAPKGYNLDETERSFSIVSDSEVISFTGDKAFEDTVIKGGVEVQKVDSEKTGTAQGRATLAGAEFTIYDSNGNPVITLVTDADGYAASAEKALLYGQYIIRETKAPRGYNLDETERSFSIVSDSEVVSFTGDDAFEDQVIRGDLKGIKIASDMQRMGGIPFSITSVTTGESHIVVTDVNGQFNTSSDWNLHSNNTNAGETASDGVWFGSINELDDSKGALPYDTYTITELPCEANEYMVIIKPFNITVSKNMVTVDLGTITNDYRPEPTLHTTATADDTDSHYAPGEGPVTINDQVEMDNLEPGWTYELSGMLMDKETGEALIIGGSEVTAAVEFTADDYTGTISMSYDIPDVSELKGKTIVVYEYLYRKGKLLASHEDINDEGQSIHFTDLHTTATDATGTHTAFAGTVTQTDRVYYSNLIPGKEVTVKGFPVYKDTGEPVKVNGDYVKAEKTFIPDTPDGYVDITFTFDAFSLAGKSIVYFESMYEDEREIGFHADLEDEGQTITFKAPPAPPETGDDNNIAAVIIICIMAIIAIMTAGIRLFIKNRNKEGAV